MMMATWRGSLVGSKAGDIGPVSGTTCATFCRRRHSSGAGPDPVAPATFRPPPSSSTFVLDLSSFTSTSGRLVFAGMID
jgi:hypothetical protein